MTQQTKRNARPNKNISGKYIKAARLKQNMTQQELSEMLKKEYGLGVSRQAIGRIERYERLVWDRELAAFSTILKTKPANIDWLAKKLNPMQFLHARILAYARFFLGFSSGKLCWLPSIASMAATAAIFRMSDTPAVIGTICTGCSRPWSTGPILVQLPTSSKSAVEILALCRPGVIKILAGPERRENGYSARISLLSATLADISPSYSKSTFMLPKISMTSRTVAVSLLIDFRMWSKRGMLRVAHVHHFCFCGGAHGNSC